MSMRIKCLEAALLALAGYASLATSAPPPSASDDSWLISNVFDGQTAVAHDFELELRVGLRDFRPLEGGNVSRGTLERRAAKALRHATLKAEDGSEPVPLDLVIAEQRSTLIPERRLAKNTSYELDLQGVTDSMTVSRHEPPPIRFTTAPGPQVTGLWRVDDTLLISFSEPMAPDTLELSAGSVDLLWIDDEDLLSLSADRNLAEFVWEAEGYLFRMAPIPELRELWVKVSGAVRGLSGAALDGDGDGEPGEVEDDYLQHIVVRELPTCYARDDRFDPCLPEDEAPEQW